ncbi:serine/threonine protein kinase, CMGC, CDC2/CDK sub [Mycoemilia scoparia]|uniref:Serine/threonine protein kinase, CMGC, CDC2/CDK sub n=1 Tax=Mycoemilia scoparia TaxID=417184 RepID=A0A9W7ZV24_9FUNG|nr:serine/threonine protein kinase, CMGC, CDC2/CDK sub [Mycoemilia scoparia]
MKRNNEHYDYDQNTHSGSLGTSQPPPVKRQAIDPASTTITTNGSDRERTAPAGIVSVSTPARGVSKPANNNGINNQADKTTAATTTATEVVAEKGPEIVPLKNKKFYGCSSFDSFDIMEKLGEGTFGEVHRAVRKSTKQVVALKKVLMHKEKDGIPITALREIKILKSLKHRNIVPLIDMVVRTPPKSLSNHNDNDKSQQPSIYMVFPYMEHDLMGLIENKRVSLTIPHIKLYMQQLLEGTAYMHKNNILHRDMKASNLLINNEGRLMIADFGLSRPYNPKERNNMTGNVVTRWYRPPELLLGDLKYTEAIDVWGVGCIFAEMLLEKALFPGTSDADQIAVIVKLCGTPDNTSWPGWQSLDNASVISSFKPFRRHVREHFMRFDDHAADLLDKMLMLDPKQRITAAQALDHPFFQSPPFPAREEDMPKFESSHEYDSRKNRPRRPHNAAAAAAAAGVANNSKAQVGGGGGVGVSPPHAPNTNSHGMGQMYREGAGIGGGGADTGNDADSSYHPHRYQHSRHGNNNNSSHHRDGGRHHHRRNDSYSQINGGGVGSSRQQQQQQNYNSSHVGGGGRHHQDGQRYRSTSRGRSSPNSYRYRDQSRGGTGGGDNYRSHHRGSHGSSHQQHHSSSATATSGTDGRHNNSYRPSHNNNDGHHSSHQRRY